MSPRIKHIPTSNAIIGRHPFVAPVERAAHNGTPWHIVENGYAIRIDDALTEKDVDLIEWLVRHGQPSRLRDARIAFSFSLYAAARALGCGRGRLIERIERRMKTLIYVRVGDWECFRASLWSHIAPHQGRRLHSDVDCRVRVAS